MATYSAYRHVELDKVGCGKRRISNPPGGPTNEIFNSPNSTPPSTPRKVKNYMASNIFTPDYQGGEQRNVRHRPDDDSFKRLFGAQGGADVADSPRVKNNQKSSIGGIFADAGVVKNGTNGHATNGHNGTTTNGTNGVNGTSNGHSNGTNGHTNGTNGHAAHENGGSSSASSGSSTPNGKSPSNGLTNGGSNGVANGNSNPKTNGTNGTNGVHAEANGKRIPPGGFSSKLW